MSTIIESSQSSPSLLGEGDRAQRGGGGFPGARTVALAALVLLAWSAILLTLPFLGPTGRQVALVGPPSRTVQAVQAAGGTIVEIRGNALIARSDHSGFAAALYRAGAPLVLESRLAGGCLGRRS